MKKEKKSAPVPLAIQAEKALKRAVIKVVAEHRSDGSPIVIWQGGKVVWVPAEQIEVREPQAEYTVSRKRVK